MYYLHKSFLTAKGGNSIMCLIVERENVVAGFINTNSDGLEFTLKDIDAYILSLWNIGCGPLRLNFRQRDLVNYLNRCKGICLDITNDGWKINKSYLSDKFISPMEKEFLHNDKNLAKSMDLFCRLQVDIRTPRLFLDAMGFRWTYA